MNREQKQAWLVIVMFGVSVIAFAALVPLVGWHRASAGFGMIGFAGLGPLIFRKRTGPGQIEIDERDKAIARQATLGGGMASYCAFILACMIPWGVLKSQGAKTMSIHTLPMIVFIGVIVFFTARAATLLVLYGREGSDGKARST